MTGGGCALALLGAAGLIQGCAQLLTGSSNTDDALKLMREANARGCVYVRASSRPWAEATLMVVGTWGQDPPSYEQCWQGLPSGVP